MPRIKQLFAISAILISSLACVTLMGEPDVIPTPAELPEITQVPATEAPTETPDEIIACPVITDKIVEMNSSFLVQGEAETMDFGGRDEDNTVYIVTYQVSGNEIADPYYESVSSDLQDEQDDSASHQKLWNYFATLIPIENRQNLAEFSVMTDGQDNILAAVGQTYTDPNLWGLEVDIADTQDYYYLSYTLVHEFAHLLTLGPNQVPPSEAIFNNPDDNDIYLNEISACPNYFPGEGCANSDSYINQYYNQFWADIYEEWDAINLEEDDDVYYKRLDDFYYKYQDQFLTDYSATHPAEDIAESFSFFIFSEMPAGDTIAGQKILFFYNYPELVALRANILGNLCISFPQ
ncbi:MAG: hypothetical protein HY863_15855 [Chloroflexi bacterium]|nr:hypothetical protein [Chloroflexota bacterium]